MPQQPSTVQRTQATGQAKGASRLGPCVDQEVSESMSACSFGSCSACGLGSGKTAEEEVVSETESGTLAFASPEALHGRQLIGLQKESSIALGGKERLGGRWKCLTQQGLALSLFRIIRWGHWPAEGTRFLVIAARKLSGDADLDLF